MHIAVAAKISPSRAAVLGLMLLAPAAIFLLANILNELGIGLLYAPVGALISEPHRHKVFNLISPVIFLGGPAAALLLNLVAIGSVDLRWERKRLVNTVTVEPRTSNVALILSVGLILAAFATYLLVENFSLSSTHQ